MFATKEHHNVGQNKAVEATVDPNTVVTYSPIDLLIHGFDATVVHRLSDKLNP